MKLKSETKQVIKFIQLTRSTLNSNLKVNELCTANGLNYDMVQRALILLHKGGIIGRDRRGPLSRYSYPEKIGVGDIVQVVQGIDIMDNESFIEDSVVEMLNTKMV